MDIENIHLDARLAKAILLTVGASERQLDDRWRWLLCRKLHRLAADTLGVKYEAWADPDVSLDTGGDIPRWALDDIEDRLGAG